MRINVEERVPLGKDFRVGVSLPRDHDSLVREVKAKLRWGLLYTAADVGFEGGKIGCCITRKMDSVDFEQEEEKGRGPLLNFVFSRGRRREAPWKYRLEWSTGVLLYSGKYIKRSRLVAQTKWLPEGPHNISSVEEILDSVLRVKVHDGKEANLIGSGREDRDVRMLGGGRPFLFQVRDYRRPTFYDLELATLVEGVHEMAVSQCSLAENELNDTGLALGVEIRELRLVAVSSENAARIRRSFHEQCGEKSKVYAFCFSLEHLSDEHWAMAERLEGVSVKLEQRTPLRVLHSRADLCRPKTLKITNLSRVVGASGLYLARVVAESGTYIKEFVHGDRGRTTPNLGSLISEKIGQVVRCDILQLDVLEVFTAASSS